MLVSVVVPLYNEEPGLEPLADDLETMKRCIEALGHRVEIVFVDDGSLDGTSWALALLYRARKDTRVVAHRENRGFGAAMRSGIEEARGAAVVCYDGDRPYPPEDAALLVEAVQGPEGADCATVSPWGPGGRAEGVSGFRRLLSRGASLLYRIALRGRGRGLTCFTSSFRAYKADALRGIEFRSDDFLAAAEVMVRLLRQDRRVIEVPATLRPRTTGVSKMKILRTVRRHLALLPRVFFGTLEEDWVDETDRGGDSALE
jgi:glycosyltransferase involved in cell wall biosynthesis